MRKANSRSEVGRIALQGQAASHRVLCLDRGRWAGLRVRWPIFLPGGRIADPSRPGSAWHRTDSRDGLPSGARGATSPATCPGTNTRRCHHAFGVRRGAAGASPPLHPLCAGSKAAPWLALQPELRLVHGGAAAGL